MGTENNESLPTYDHTKIYRLIPNGSSWVAWDVEDIQSALEAGFNSGPTVTVTSVAVDPLTMEVFVGSWTYGLVAESTTYRSMVQKFPVKSSTPVAVYGLDPIFTPGGNQSSIKDLRVWGGDLWVLGGTTEGGNSGYSYRGLSGILRLSTSTLEPVESTPSALAGDYTSSGQTAEPVTANGSMGNTLKFATGWSNGQIYVIQLRLDSGPPPIQDIVLTQHDWTAGTSAEVESFGYASEPSAQ